MTNAADIHPDSNSNTVDLDNERSIGDIVRDAHQLSAQEVEQVLAHQRKSGLKFGEAAMALGLLKREDVVWALSQQFEYNYAAEESMPELVVANRPFSRHAEIIRDLRAQLINTAFKPQENGKRKALAIVSADVGDGRSYVAANLAVAFSQLGGKTLLIDADMRGPRQHDIFKMSEAKRGLSNVLLGRSEPNVIKQVKSLKNLFVLPVGTTPPNPTELVQRPVLGLVLQSMLERFDYVLVDTPASVHGADARVIAAACGQALLLGRKDRSRIPALRQLADSMKQMGANVCGVAMNDYTA